MSPNNQSEQHPPESVVYRFKVNEQLPNYSQPQGAASTDSPSPVLYATPEASSNHAQANGTPTLDGPQASVTPFEAHSAARDPSASSGSNQGATFKYISSNELSERSSTSSAHKPKSRIAADSSKPSHSLSLEEAKAMFQTADKTTRFQHPTDPKEKKREDILLMKSILNYKPFSDGVNKYETLRDVTIDLIRSYHRRLSMKKVRSYTRKLMDELTIRQENSKNIPDGIDVLSDLEREFFDYLKERNYHQKSIDSTSGTNQPKEKTSSHKNTAFQDPHMQEHLQLMARQAVHKRAAEDFIEHERHFNGPQIPPPPPPPPGIPQIIPSDMAPKRIRMVEPTSDDVLRGIAESLRALNETIIMNSNTNTNLIQKVTEALLTRDGSRRDENTRTESVNESESINKRLEKLEDNIDNIRNDLSGISSSLSMMNDFIKSKLDL